MKRFNDTQISQSEQDAGLAKKATERVVICDKLNKIFNNNADQTKQQSVVRAEAKRKAPPSTSTCEKDIDRFVADHQNALSKPLEKPRAPLYEPTEEASYYDEEAIKALIDLIN